jgi:hypothetical protein
MKEALMKRTILVVLMTIIIATPCLAQEVETDGIFSIDGTRWESLPITMMIFPIPWLFPDTEYSISFSDGKVYPSLEPATNSFYLDLGIVSIFMYENVLGGWGTVFHRETGFGIFQPIGIGMMISSSTTRLPVPMIGMSLLIKTDDDDWPISE